VWRVWGGWDECSSSNITSSNITSRVVVQLFANVLLVLLINFVTGDNELHNSAGWMGCMIAAAAAAAAGMSATSAALLIHLLTEALLVLLVGFVTGHNELHDRCWVHRLRTAATLSGACLP
jgi:hypothetical protein